jgi:hypothetical protein
VDYIGFFLVERCQLMLAGRDWGSWPDVVWRWTEVVVVFGGGEREEDSCVAPTREQISHRLGCRGLWSIDVFSSFALWFMILFLNL